MPQVGVSAYLVPWVDSSLLSRTLFLHYNYTLDFIYRWSGPEETTRISLILGVGGIKNSDLSTSFCHYSHLMLNNLKWIGLFVVVSLMALRSEKCKTNDKYFFCKSFLTVKFIYTKILFSCF